MLELPAGQPQAFTVAIVIDGEPLTLTLRSYSLRGSNFRVGVHREGVEARVKL